MKAAIQGGGRSLGAYNSTYQSNLTALTTCFRASVAYALLPQNLGQKPGPAHRPGVWLGHHLCHQSIAHRPIRVQTLCSKFGSTASEAVWLVLRFRDITGFVLQMPLLYIPPSSFTQNLEIFLKSQIDEQCSVVRQVPGRIIYSSYFQRTLIYLIRAHERNRQTGLLFKCIAR